MQSTEREEETPFSCFGSSSSSNSSASDGSHDNNDDNIDRELALGRRLVKQANRRQNNAKVTPRLETATTRASCQIELLPATSPHYEVFDSSRAGGKGLRALKDFCYGDEILRESASVRVPIQQAATSLEEAQRLHAQAIQNSFDGLHPTTQGAYMELSTCIRSNGNNDNQRDALVGIYQTNSYQLGDENDGGIFLTLARINHSCRPNSNQIWRPDLQQSLVFATRDIRKGEEFFTSYGPPEWLDTAGRRSYLKERFSFDCRCDRCLGGGGEDDDRQCLELTALQDTLSLLPAPAALEAVERCRTLLQAQGNSSGLFLKSLLHKGYQVALWGLNDEPMARDYLSQELRATIMCEGVGCPNAIALQQLLDDMSL